MTFSFLLFQGDRLITTTKNEPEVIIAWCNGETNWML